MRIITGRARGMKLLPPKDYAVRPTSDRVKGSTLQYHQGPYCRRCGSGCLWRHGKLSSGSVEQGARKVVLFDKNRESLRLIRFNVEKAKAGADAIIRHTDAIKGIADAKGNGEIYDLVFPTPL